MRERRCTQSEPIPAGVLTGGETHRVNHVRIVALGSGQGDDQIGWHVGERLATDPKLAGRVFRLSSPWDVAEHFEAGRQLIILDACRSSVAPPGQILRLRPEDVAATGRRGHSIHGGSLAEGLEMARALGRRCEGVVIYAAVIDSCAVGAELSDAGLKAAEELEVEVRRELSRWGVDG